MGKRWTDTQRQLWTGWFQVVKKLDPTGTGVNWGTEGFVQGWQDAVQKARDAQAEWLRLWSVGQGSNK